MSSILQLPHGGQGQCLFTAATHTASGKADALRTVVAETWPVTRAGPGDAELLPRQVREKHLPRLGVQICCGPDSAIGSPEGGVALGVADVYRPSRNSTFTHS